MNPSLSGRDGAKILLPTAIWGFHLSGYSLGLSTKKKIWPASIRGSATIHIDLHTATQLCQLIDALYDAYTDHIEKILSIMGCAGFDTDNLDRIPVLYLAKGVWQDMFHFANEHSVYDGQAQWNCFYPVS